MQQLINIQKISLSNNIIAVQLEKIFEQEQCANIFAQISERLTNITLLERSFGADREAYRFQWYEHYFAMQFDLYSQSIWVEADDEISLPSVVKLMDKFQQMYAA